jgi:phosphohistidine phosphatase SixA
MKFDDVVILSSPFIRAMQTANGIALELMQLGVNEVRHNYLICEHLTKEDFPNSNPLHNLEFIRYGAKSDPT